MNALSITSGGERIRMRIRSDRKYAERWVVRMMTEQPLVPGAMAEHTSCLLVKVGQVMYRLAENDLGQLGMRVRHYNILQALADNGPMSQLTLGADLRIDPATMVASLDDLERAAFARRARDSLDRRRYMVEITAAGRKVLRRTNRGLAILDESALADLSTAERDVLHRILTKLSGGSTLPAAFDKVRDQAGSRKMSSSS